MPLTTQEWHERYRQQAGWTEALRAHLFTRLRLSNRSRLLEVGCGTGALIESLRRQTTARPYGLDIDLSALGFARRSDRQARLTGGDALHLPYPDQTFDLVLCHFLLLWVSDPAAALAEMARVCRPGGLVTALAEPDYGGRIDHPPALVALGQWQREALHRQGADPLIGRKLSGLLNTAGLQQVETGVLGGRWNSPPNPAEWQTEWRVLADDLRASLPPDELAKLMEQDRIAWQTGERVLYVPTFYGWGRKV